jgi:hypothetical protein
MDKHRLRQGPRGSVFHRSADASGTAVSGSLGGILGSGGSPGDDRSFSVVPPFATVRTYSETPSMRSGTSYGTDPTQGLQAFRATDRGWRSHQQLRFVLHRPG